MVTVVTGVTVVTVVTGVTEDNLRTDDFFSNLVLSVECNGDRARFMMLS